jgi:hypothetical protein
VILHRAGLPAPQLHLPVYDTGNSLLGTATFGYPAARVVGEFDGYIRYGRSLCGGDFAAELPAGIAQQEMDREHRLRQAGWLVVRWTWPDLDTPGELTRQLSEALADRAGHAGTGRQSTSIGAR